ncbi:MAG: sodium:solute symporter family protein [Bacillota bacterium]
MEAGYTVGAAAAFGVITVAGVVAAKRSRSYSDFSIGGRSFSSPMVAGVIIGTVYGGSATVGTAQLAFRYGFSAWWFTLGSGIALLVLALFLAAPLRRQGITTVPQFIEDVYGRNAAVWASVFTCVGMFLNVLSQVIAAGAILSSCFGLGTVASSLITAVCIVAYVAVSGVWGASLVGIAKAMLVVGSMTVVGILAYSLGATPSALMASLPRYPYFSLFGRGLWADLAAAFSMVVGINSSQTYIQAMCSARNVAAARAGAVIAGAIATLAGIPPVIVGMLMRLRCPGMLSQDALPRFVLEFMPSWLAGLTLATVFISTLGTAAGLSLGIGTILSSDLYRKLFRPSAPESQLLAVSRAGIVGTALLAAAVMIRGTDATILKWGFLSLGLRGATVFFPLVFGVFARKRVSPSAGAAAIVAAPLASIVWGVLNPQGLDPLYIGLATSAMVMVLGLAHR